MSNASIRRTPVIVESRRTIGYSNSLSSSGAHLESYQPI